MNTQLTSIDKKINMISEVIKIGKFEYAKNELEKLSDELLPILHNSDVGFQESGDTSFGDSTFLLAKLCQLLGHCHFLCSEYDKALLEYKNSTKGAVSLKRRKDLINRLRYLGSCTKGVMSPEYLVKHKKTLTGEYDPNLLLQEDLETYGRLLAIGYSLILYVIPKERLEPILDDPFYVFVSPYIDEYKNFTFELI